jgi:hypothetical protein
MPVSMTPYASKDPVPDFPPDGAFAHAPSSVAHASHSMSIFTKPPGVHASLTRAF